MNQERQVCPRVWRLTQQVGITKQFVGERELVVLSNPGRVEAVRFRGKLYKKTENETLVLFSDEELLKIRS